MRRVVIGNIKEIIPDTNLNERSTPSVIKKAYRAAILKAHPDKGGDKETFQQLTEAHDGYLKEIDQNTKPARYLPLTFYTHHTRQSSQ